MSDVKARMQAWVGSANCWCDKEDKAYCTVCEIMIDALEEIEYLEGLMSKKVEAVESSPVEGVIPETTVGH